MDTLNSTNSTAGTNKLYWANGGRKFRGHGKGMQPRTKGNGSWGTTPKKHLPKTPHILHTPQFRNLKPGSLNTVEQRERGSRIYLDNEGLDSEA